MIANLLVNFGGPRSLSEIAPFLTELLSDRDVIRTRFPSLIHNWIFGRIARKRALEIAPDYERIGGRSPIYFDTESLCSALSERLQEPVFSFHRYLPETHAATLQKIEEAQADEIRVFPLFPQFCYATTGSIARFFGRRLSSRSLNKLRWIKSYAAHPSFVAAYKKRIADFLQSRCLEDKDSVLLFSAHGVPVSFVETGDPYESECRLSYHACLNAFPNAIGRLCYQSKFGPGEWLKPATDTTCEQILTWHQGRKFVIFIPITFTSDHIKTLFEVEKLYLPLIQKKGLNAYRCPALNCEPYWVDAIAEILQEPNNYPNEMLIRRS